MSLNNMRTMEKKRMMIWKLNKGIMYLFEETQGIKNFSILQKLKEKIFNSPKKFKENFQTSRKFKSKIFQSYENSNQKIFNPTKSSKTFFPILRKFKIKIF